LGKPLIMYGGIFTLALMLFAAAIPSLQKKWPTRFNFRLHVVVARVAIVLALLHGFLGMMIYL